MIPAYSAEIKELFKKKKKKNLNFLRRIQQFFLVGNFCPEEEKK